MSPAMTAIRAPGVLASWTLPQVAGRDRIEPLEAQGAIA